MTFSDILIDLFKNKMIQQHINIYLVFYLITIDQINIFFAIKM